MVALRGKDIDAFLARPDPGRPIILLYGPDAGLVRERAEALIASAVDDPNDPFSLVRLDGDELSAEPSRLVDEAMTIPMFGGRRAIRVRAGSRSFASGALPAARSGRVDLHHPLQRPRPRRARRRPPLRGARGAVPARAAAHAGLPLRPRGRHAAVPDQHAAVVPLRGAGGVGRRGRAPARPPPQPRAVHAGRGRGHDGGPVRAPHGRRGRAGLLDVQRRAVATDRRLHRHAAPRRPAGGALLLLLQRQGAAGHDRRAGPGLPALRHGALRRLRQRAARPVQRGRAEAHRSPRSPLQPGQPRLGQRDGRPPARAGRLRPAGDGAQPAGDRARRPPQLLHPPPGLAVPLGALHAAASSSSAR